MSKIVMRRSSGLSVVFCASLMVSLAWMGWVIEPRQYRTAPPVSAALESLKLMPNGIAGTPPEVYFALGKPYERTSYDLSQGKRLYSWFGCPVCHKEGEGGIGPAFLDGWWLYGPSMVSIAASIRDGRPHGMPAFRDKMTIDQIWQLAGYVKTIGAYSAQTTAPARNDDPQTRPAENRAPAAILFNEGPSHAWAATQRASAAEPSTSEASAGKTVFLKKQCSACHTVRGTSASGSTGPDLTHVGSRKTIAAGLLENTRGSLAAWIADPQTLKPGNNMPLVPLSADELRQVSAYMESLK